MKHGVIFLVLSYIVAVNCGVHRITGQFVTRTHRFSGGPQELGEDGGDGGNQEFRVDGGGERTQVIGGDGGQSESIADGSGASSGGDGETRVHRITGQVVRRRHRIPGEKRTHVHRIPGERRTRVHRITGDLITNKHSFRISGSGGVPPVQPPRGGGVPNVPSGQKLPPGPNVPSLPGGPALPTRSPSVTAGVIRCRKSGLTALADKLNVGLQTLTNKIALATGAAAPDPNIIGHIFGGAQTLLDNTLGGLDQGVSDFFCGFDRVFNVIGDGIHDGNLLKAVIDGANVFISGAGSFFGNLGANGIDAIASGVSDLAYGRRSKKPNEIVHSTHGDLTDVIHG